VIVHTPIVCTHWGDWVCHLWAAELLSTLEPTIEQSYDPTFYERPDRSQPSNLLDWIKVPWASSFSVLDPVVASKRFDRILSTHHRHVHKRDMYAGVPSDRMLFFDAHGISFRCVTQGWYPGFIPTQRTLDEVAKLRLPEKYNVIHLNEPLNDCRYTTSVREFISKHEKEITGWSSEIILVSTSCSINVPGIHVIDASKLPGWLKIAVMIGANDVWGSHSGFTSIASMYRRGRNLRGVKLVNEYGISILNMGPPPVCYSNYIVSDPGTVTNTTCGSVHDYRRRCLDAWKDWRSFEHFESVHERCHVPVNAKFMKLNGSREWTFDDRELLNVSSKVLDPELFRRYH